MPLTVAVLLHLDQTGSPAYRPEQGQPFASPMLQHRLQGLRPNRAPVAAQFLTLTYHPGLDLVVVFIRVGDGAGGNYLEAGLVKETQAKRGADDSGSDIEREPTPLIVRFLAGATSLF